MRKIKKFVSMFLAAALLVLLPDAAAFTASAEEPATYYIRYIEKDDAWRTQKLSVWDDSRENGGLDYVTNNIKAGDLLIIEGDGKKDLRLEIGVHLNNLTIKNAGLAVITVKDGIDNCFVLKNSVAAVNGDITNAYAYDNARCNFNNNVTNLYLQGEPKLEATVVVAGTVTYAKFGEESRTIYEFYQFEANSFVTENGIIRTDASKYRTSAPDQSPAPAPAPAASDSSGDSSSAASHDTADEYDDVPKTGESSFVWQLLCMGIACLGGCFLLLGQKRL
ncbi:MAG: hypothetical protein NC081_01265 [Roseburia sp.]|nr:hypothetical protein [Roseburia sp.]